MPRLLFQILAIVSVVLLVYSHAPQAEFLPRDDGLLIYSNPLVHELSQRTIAGVFSSYDPELYIPLTLMSYQIDWLIGDGAPWIFHLTNVLLHALDAVLVLLLVRTLTKAPRAAFLTAAFFALHPLHTEAVMWISARKDLLSASFFLGSLLTYCQFRLRDTRLPYYLSLVLFACALLSKVVAFTLPLTFIIVDDILGIQNTTRDRLRQLPYIVLAVVFVLIGLFGKSLSTAFIGYGDTVLLATKSAGFYIQKLVLPMDLMPLYQQAMPLQPLSLEFVAPFAVLTLLYVLAIASRSIHKAISFGILWYGITVLPSVANFSAGTDWSVYFASDRYAYLPSIGILLVIAIGVTHIRNRAVGISVTATTMAIFCLLTYQQSLRWTSGETLFTYVADHAPRTHKAHTILGLLDLKKGQYNDAIAHLHTAVELSPHDAEARAHLGLATIKTGNVNGGQAELTQTIAADPTYLPAYVYQAYGYVLQGKTNQARKVLEFVLQLDTDNAEALELIESI